MLTITTKPIRWTADHFLAHVSGEDDVHPHHYQFTLEYTAEDLVDGMLPDYDVIEPMLRATVSPLHAVLLNTVPGLDNPTSENVLLWIRARLAIPRRAILVSLTLAKDGARCSWREPMTQERIAELGRRHLAQANATPR